MAWIHVCLRFVIPLYSEFIPFISSLCTYTHTQVHNRLRLNRLICISSIRHQIHIFPYITQSLSFSLSRCLSLCLASPTYSTTREKEEELKWEEMGSGVAMVHWTMIKQTKRCWIKYSVASHRLSSAPPKYLNTKDTHAHIYHDQSREQHAHTFTSYHFYSFVDASENKIMHIHTHTNVKFYNT